MQTGQATKHTISSYIISTGALAFCRRFCAHPHGLLPFGLRILPSFPVGFQGNLSLPDIFSHFFHGAKGKFRASDANVSRDSSEIQSTRIDLEAATLLKASAVEVLLATAQACDGSVRKVPGREAGDGALAGLGIGVGVDGLFAATSVVCEGIKGLSTRLPEPQQHQFLSGKCSLYVCFCMSACM